MPDLDRLRARAKITFPESKPEFLLARVRAIVASEKDMPPDEQGRLATAALRKLEGLEVGDPTAAELAALELMIRMTRPAPLVHQSIPDDFKRPEHSNIFPSWSSFRSAAKPFLPTIGRIDTAGPSLGASTTVGTGFLVGSGLLMTNKHVLDELSRGTGMLESGQGVVRFQIEDNSFDEDRPRKITGVAGVHPAADAVLLAVEEASLGPVQPYPKLSTTRKDDDEVVVAGYPSEMSDRNPLFVRSTFTTSLGVLRAAPGRISEISPDGFAHDCSTLGGNSGSPVFRMNTAEVIGLHTGGSFLWKNYAVDGAVLATFVNNRSGAQ